jgi:predicted TIM-barrel fold metal-dependent hydrolase
MLMVDAQVHIWTSGTPVNIHRQVPAYTKDELLRDMDAAGVRGVVLHPPSWDAKANEVAIDAARRHPDRLAVLGFFDVSRPENRSLIDTWRNQPGMLGLRFAFLRPGEENWMVDGTTDWLWPAAERAGLPVGLLAPNRLKELGAIAAKHPKLKLLIDHMARPRGSRDDAGFSDIG